MPETNSGDLEGISSLAAASRESTESIAPLKKASEAQQAPRLMIPVTSGMVHEKSFRPTEAEATMYDAISYDDYRAMKNLSDKNSSIYQLADRDNGTLLTVRAEDVRKAEEAYKARNTRPAPLPVSQII